MDGQPASMDAALDALVERLNEFLELHGAGCLAIVGSPRMSHEGNIMAARLAEMLGAGTLSFFSDVVHAERAQEAVSLLHAGTGASQDDVRHADLVAVMDCDLLDEAPMMALAVRQAWRNGAQVFVIGSECQIDAAQQELFDSTAVPALSDVPLASAVRPVVICGTRHKGLEQIRAAAASGARLAFVLDGPNTCGCAQLACEHGALPLSQAVADGRVKGIISLEADLPVELLDGIRVLGVPTGARPGCWPEARSYCRPAPGWSRTAPSSTTRGAPSVSNRSCGLDCRSRGLTPESHPPRVHRHDAPGGDLLPAWRIVAELMERLGGERVESPLDRQWPELQGLDAEGPGVVLKRAK